jgi:SAM-dependent methyltransferase
MLDRYEDEIEIFENCITRYSDGKPEITILEAGCGRKWPLNLTGVEYRLIGLDLNEKSLEIRVNEMKDLDEAIVGDLHEIDLGDRKVDVVYNSFVLEHVEDADKVLDNLGNLLKPGGVLILRLPDRNTVFGFVTRLSPFWFHVWYRKYIRGAKTAGKPGFGPFPTHYCKVVSRKGIHEFCETHGFAIDEEVAFCQYLSKRNFGTKLVRISSMLLSALSFGRLPWKHDNLSYVLSKNA